MLLEDMIALYPFNILCFFALRKVGWGVWRVSGSAHTFINELHDRALPPPYDIGTTACQSLATKHPFEKWTLHRFA